MTAIDFNLLPNKPPPQDVFHLSSDERDDGEDEEDEAEVDEAMDEDPSSPRRDLDGDTTMLTPGVDGVAGSSSMDLLGLTIGATQTATTEADGSDSDGPDGLFEDDDEDEQEDDAQEPTAAGPTGVPAPQAGEKRKLNEDDEYD